MNFQRLSLVHCLRFLQIPWTGCRGFFKVFHTCQCIFSVLLFAQELRNGQRHARLPRKGAKEEKKEETCFPVELLSPGDMRRWTLEDLKALAAWVGFLFRFRDVTRFFRSRYVTRDTMPRVEWVTHFSETIPFFSFFFFFRLFLLCLSMRHAPRALRSVCKTREPDPRVRWNGSGSVVFRRGCFNICETNAKGYGGLYDELFRHSWCRRCLKFCGIFCSKIVIFSQF